MSVSSCATKVYNAEMGFSREVAANLPKDQALIFLQSLYVPETANSCRFEENGVSRWWKGKLPGTTPYNLIFIFLAGANGIPFGIELSVRGTNEAWCLIIPYEMAKRQGKDTKKFSDKIFTALLSMGATIIPASELAKGLTCRAGWCQKRRPAATD
ncbi:hypothetical protein [Candidatus Thiodictyon syntrophicum]|jgi:hypothetical protein|uniref:hypothetical protein n=1 Tax=Candidatus Thiodictyon syntrophicum TaxID=1166950 RepID=UPI0012FE785F|nr:hypothetical protein [Candidatus Thiodictyon syntrophicum]